MEHPSLYGFLTDGIFLGMVGIMIAIGFMVAISSYYDILNMCDPFNNQKRRIKMLQTTYPDLVLEEGEKDDMEAYFERNSVEWVKEEKEFSTTYVVQWVNTTAAFAFYTWTLYNALRNHELRTPEAIDACAKYMPINELTAA